MKKIILNLIMILCIVSFAFFSYKIYNYKKEEKKQEEIRDNLIENAITISIQENNESKNINPHMEINFDILKSKNKDIVAWIYSEETPINYPIVQSKDNVYYLRRLLDGTYNQGGTIFMDYRNDRNFEDYNTIIYGHNMKNNTMFGTLINYKKQEYFNEHPYIYLFSENKKYKIELFAGYVTSSKNDIYNFPQNINTNEKLIKTAKEKSTFKSNTNVISEDKIITFSTCSYDFEDARYVLLGVAKDY